MTKNVFAYIRISDPKQGAGVSLEAQRDAIKVYAEQNNLSITDWFEERETAAKQGRAVFAKVVKLLQSGKASGLVVHKIDRSVRNLSDWAKIGDLQDSGVQVYFAADNVDFSTNSGRLTADIHAVMAAHYIRNLREEALKGLNGRLKQGLYPFKAPIGYIDKGGGKAKTICPRNGPIVQELFRLYGTGEHSILTLLDEAHRLGLGKSSGGKITKTCIEKMLRNPFYIGLMHVKSRGETYKGIHEPLISPALFDRVTAIREGRSVKKKTKHDRTYRRMFHCGFCGKAYVPEEKKEGIYYRCHTKDCVPSTLREDRMEKQVVEFLKGLELSSVQQKRLWDRLVAWVDQLPVLESQAPSELEIGKVKAKREQLLDAFLDGLIDKQTYEQRNHDLLVLETQHSETPQNQRSKDDLLDDAHKLFEVLKTLCETYHLAISSEKRRLLEILSSNRLVFDQNVEIEPKNWSRKAAKTATVLLGGPSRYETRGNPEFPVSVIDDLNEVFNMPDWREFCDLAMEIKSRDTNGDLPEIPSQTS